MNSVTGEPQADPARVEQLFHAAAGLPESEQKAFLTRECPIDSPLFTAVRELLDAAGRADLSWDRSAMRLEARHTAVDLPQPRPGEFFGPYRILRCIRSGGMGSVYEAVRDDNQFRKKVAIKIVQRGLDDGTAIERFRMERQILAPLEHPYIARLHDGGATPDGMPFLVMEFVEGLPVDQYADGQNLNRAGRLRLFLLIAEAVEYAHQNLVVHGDLKPGNVLVTADGIPKLLDFGIATQLNTGQPGARAAALTPQYASPEQVKGSPITTASDVYSLGVLLFQLLAERLPYSPMQTPERQPVWDPPGWIDADLRHVLAKAMHQEPAKRYASAERFAADLRRYLECRPVAARSGAGYRARKFIRRRVVALALVTAVVMALATGGFSTWQESRRAERRFNELRGLAHALLFEVYDSASSFTGSLAMRRLLVKRVQQYLDEVARDVGVDSSLAQELAESYLRLGDVQGRPYRPNLGETAAALESYRKALVLLEAESVRHPSDRAVLAKLSEAYRRTGIVLAREGKVEEAIRTQKSAVAAAIRCQDRELVSDAYLGLGQAQLIYADAHPSVAAYQPALESYQTSVRVHESTGPSTDAAWLRNLARGYMHVSYGLESIAQLTGNQADIARGLDYQLRAFQLQQQVRPPDRRGVADILNDIGRTRTLLHDYTGALRNFQQVLREFQQISAADPQNLEARRDLANVYGNIGEALAAARQSTQARDADRKALEIYEKLSQADPSSNEDALHQEEMRRRLALLQAMSH